eukprot:Protomagalhaensia_sp_Gyna_25__830@NODE_13_length_8454_cov_77_233868_g9_i0_p5_GENE_NODE_13_length_8454_cov_77_233868_g9_i0NODE_13_length_8454_cov_77_233868_g9_i0_p5_ORF_typecomplete_len322_score58_82UPF0016/PF01169_19/1_6e04UPF0016/PF01169_19/0_25_NODE_13_length_8454_cov_77_233868_g9_i051306095
MLVAFFCLVVLAAILCTVDGKCQPRILIATDPESEEVAEAVIEELQRLKASQRLSFAESAALACVVYSPTTSVELLVPWSGNFHDTGKLLECHRKKQAGNRSAIKKAVAANSHLDVLKEEALLALKFFKGMENDGLVLLLTGSQQDTKLDSAIPEAANVPVVVGYTDNNYLATQDSSAALRFVDLSRNERTKIHVLAQFLLEARCTGDATLPIRNNKNFQQVAQPNQQSTERVELESTAVSAPLDEARHIPAGVAAGSVAVASAGVAGLSVFAGRWFQKRSSDEDEESPAPQPLTPSTFSTPVPTQRLPASPVQHITFSMF